MPLVNLGKVIKRAKDILEVHYDDKILKRNEVSDGSNDRSVSISTLVRDFKIVTSLKDVDIYIKVSSWKHQIPLFMGFKKEVEKGDRRRLVFILAFKYKPNFNTRSFGTKRLFQVDLVEVSPEIEGQSLATSVYRYLVNQNSTIISDNHQYKGGKSIWKKLAKESDLKVTIYNSELSEFILDSYDKPIIYDGNNIPDNIIWSDQWNSKVSENILLVLNKR